MFEGVCGCWFSFKTNAPPMVSVAVSPVVVVSTANSVVLISPAGAGTRAKSVGGGVRAWDQSEAKKSYGV